jgi:hypothetical protein
MNVYRYSREGRYEYVLDYTTKVKYPITRGDEIVAAVIGNELKTIQAKVDARPPVRQRNQKGGSHWWEDMR